MDSLRSVVSLHLCDTGIHVEILRDSGNKIEGVCVWLYRVHDIFLVKKLATISFR